MIPRVMMIAPRTVENGSAPYEMVHARNTIKPEISTQNSRRVASNPQRPITTARNMPIAKTGVFSSFKSFSLVGLGLRRGDVHELVLRLLCEGLGLAAARLVEDVPEFSGSLNATNVIPWDIEVIERFVDGFLDGRSFLLHLLEEGVVGAVPRVVVGVYPLQVEHGGNGL